MILTILRRFFLLVLQTEQGSVVINYLSDVIRISHLCHREAKVMTMMTGYRSTLRVIRDFMAVTKPGLNSSWCAGLQTHHKSPSSRAAEL